jgi:hypothetical protein
MAELTDEEKRVLEKLRQDRFGPRPSGEKHDPTSDPRKWDAPIGLDDDGQPFPVDPDEAEQRRLDERVQKRKAALEREEAEERARELAAGKDKP